ncbi:MAG: UbiX family flavin prenyltransferase, partial [Nitriliruptorales bacterium]|nr:UbiX family flavin prenyltransferase [Nitriliruptorales bacterium]
MSAPRLIVGITGATGAIYGIRLLERLSERDIETHLILSPWGKRTIEHETDYTVERVQGLASSVNSYNDLAAAISSGSFVTAGMIVAPCSVKTLASISHGFADNLISRAADVVLKERRRLVLLVRETPLSEVHLENMLRLARMGVVVMPPMPAFYNHPKDIAQLVDNTVARALDQLEIPAPWAKRWDGRLRRR